MRNIRTCESALLNTGGSTCQIDWGRVKGCIIVEKGQKLPAELTKETLEELCHADRPGRVYPIPSFVEYAKNGGEPQVNAVGYGPSQYNGMSAETETFTLPKFDETLNAKLLQAATKEWDVYFYDDKFLYGYNDGTDILAGMSMSTIYPAVTPFSTSSSKSTMTVSFCHTDIEDLLTHIDFVKLNFNIKNGLKGLTEVSLVSKEANKYKLIEKIGGYDLTPLHGGAIAKAATEVLNGATSATYADGILTVVPAGDGGTISLKAPSVLYENGIKYIEGVSA